MNKTEILIIDDEVDFGLLMKSFFKPKNYDVFIAHTIADGLKTLEEQKPDFLFLDNNLRKKFLDPDISSYTVTALPIGIDLDTVHPIGIVVMKQR